MTGLQKKACFSDRPLKIIKNFFYTEHSTGDQIITDFYVLNDITRKELFELSES